MGDPTGIQRRYREFAETECRGYSDLYYRLALSISEDDRLASFIAGMDETQPNLFLASIQLLTGPVRMPATGAELRAFVEKRGDEVRALTRARRTQTNEVGRCAVLLPALPPGPLALVEIGASAGLCLLFERYSYEYGSSQSGPTRLGPVSSGVRLRCTTTGPVPLPGVIPRIAWRRGLDLRPIDVHDDDAVRWLSACVWPEHHERRRRLEGALAAARADPPVVRAGDLVDDLPALLAEAPDDVQLVVFHSGVLSYVSRERRRAFADVLADASERRDIIWLANEAAGVVPELPTVAPSGSLRFLVGRTRFANGVRRSEPLALAHPHGAELAWL
jgi:hypothetical protein